MTIVSNNREKKVGFSGKEKQSVQNVERIKKEILQERPKQVINPNDLLSLGYWPLNLACSGNPDGGLLKGQYYLFIGDSDSGKTYITRTCQAEAKRNQNFRNYRIIYDVPEGRDLINVEKHFGKAVASSLEPPSRHKDNSPRYSEILEEFYWFAEENFKKGPCIYILDSIDSLSTKAERKKGKELRNFHFKERKNDNGDGKEPAGSYGDGKAKINSSGIRQLLSPLKSSGSILIIINQTRDNVGGFVGWGNEKTRSGGHALVFYAALQIWTSIKGVIWSDKNIHGKKRQLGIKSLVKIKRNSITGKRNTVEVPIYHSYGIDEVGGCIDYLVEEKHWNKKGKEGSGDKEGGIIEASEFDFVGTREKLVQRIESENEEKLLKKLVSKVWQEIDSACEIKRKPKYQ